MKATPTSRTMSQPSWGSGEMSNSALRVSEMVPLIIARIPAPSARMPT